jgi:hypothetical protein
MPELQNICAVAAAIRQVFDQPELKLTVKKLAERG